MKKYYLILLLFIIKCTKDKSINTSVDTFTNFKIPNNFPNTIYDFSLNEITKDKYELGRKLFYEPILSINNTISCGSCHQQRVAFVHSGHDVSHGIFDKLGTRNTPPIQNLAWSKSFMWDGGIGGLDVMPIAPITNSVEMGETLENVLKKLNNHNTYPQLFEKAFNSKIINTTNFLKALSQFMLMLVSANSKYDRIKRNEGDTFTFNELEGYKLFIQKCSTCHKEPLFTTQEFKNNGLSISPINDKGVGNISTFASDNYKFKIPSLRNIAITAPYMHDGRYLTLDAVLEHYNSLVQKTQNLDSIFINGNILGIKLTQKDKENIISFLNTLTDNDFIKNTNFSENN